MKAVVVERRGESVAVLDHEGIVHVIKNPDYMIGQELELTAEELDRADREYKKEQQHTASTKRAGKVRSLHRFSQMAAAFFAVLLVGGSVTAYAAPVSTVTVDTNTSIEYKTNVFDRVLSVSAYDADGEEFVASIEESVKGKKIERAIEMTLDAIDEDEQITEEDTVVLVTVDSKLRSKEAIEKKISETAENWDKNRKEQKKASGNEEDVSGIAVTTTGVTQEMKDLAKENNVSPGRQMYNELNEERNERFREKEAVPADGTKPELPEGTPTDGTDVPTDTGAEGTKPQAPAGGKQNGTQPEIGNGTESNVGTQPEIGNGTEPNGGTQPEIGNGTEPNGGTQPEIGGGMEPNGGAQPENGGGMEPNGGAQPENGNGMAPMGGQQPENVGEMQPMDGTQPESEEAVQVVQPEYEQAAPADVTHTESETQAYGI